MLLLTVVQYNASVETRKYDAGVCVPWESKDIINCSCFSLFYHQNPIMPPVFYHRFFSVGSLCVMDTNNSYEQRYSIHLCSTVTSDFILSSLDIFI